MSGRMYEGAPVQGARENPVSSYVLRERLNAALALVPDGAASLLDICCGEGYFLKALEGRSGLARIGFDLSEANARFAERLCQGACVFVADAEAIPIMKGARFSVVAVLEALDHFEEPEKLLRRAAGFLEKGGMLVVSVPDSGSWLWNFIWFWWVKTFGRKWEGSHKVQFDEKGLGRMLEKTGLRRVKFRRTFFGTIIAANGVKDG